MSVPNDYHGNADVLVATAKTRQSEQGALKRGGIDLLVMPPSLNDKLSLWRSRSVEPLRGLVKPRNYLAAQVGFADVVVVEQLLAAAGHGDLAGLEHVAARGD